MIWSQRNPELEATVQLYRSASGRYAVRVLDDCGEAWPGITTFPDLDRARAYAQVVLSVRVLS